ncbi:MAG: hypothetical protein ACLRFF_01445 [Alphaproteobacteria bacterium]
MHLNWEQKDFDKDIDFILFHQKDKTPVWWHKQLFNAYPDLDYDYCWNSGISEEQRFKYIIKQMKIQAQKRQPVIEKSINIFQKAWMDIADNLNDAYSSAFDNDCLNILNSMTAEVGLNPICPRYIENHKFDIYHYFDVQHAILMALHEITHFVWFYFWQQHFKDNINDYDYPNLKWLLSEIVVETIIRNSKINDLIKQPKYIAYSYFYDMKIGDELIFETMRKMYLNRKDIFDFMEKSFDWVKNNETELRNKIAEAEK